MSESRRDRITKLPAGSHQTLGELIDDDEQCPITVDPAEPKRCQLRGRHFKAVVPCYFANSNEMSPSQRQYHAYPDPAKEPA